MSKTAAAITLALASTFATGAANAHDNHGHHGNYNHGHYYHGPVYRPYIPPVYVRPRTYVPPVYVAPLAPPIYNQPEGLCTPTFNRYGQETGSIRQNVNPYTGELSQPFRSPALCY